MKQLYLNVSGDRRKQKTKREADFLNILYCLKHEVMTNKGKVHYTQILLGVGQKGGSMGSMCGLIH